MKLVKTVPLALFIFSTGVGCSSTMPPSGTGGTGGTGTGGTGTGGTSAGGTSTGGTSTGGTSTGGTSTGGTSTGGTGTGGDGTGGAPDPLDPANIVPGLDGTFWALRALNAEQADGKYWLTAETTCDAAGTTLTKPAYTAGGTPGQQYTVHFQVRGALALRCYEGGTTTATAPDAEGVKNNGFYAGGQASGDGPTLSLTVAPAAADAAAGKYFLNGIPSDSGACDQTITYDVGYEGEFVVLGGSTVTLDFLSPDCQALENCGPDAAAACAGRSIDMADFEVHASPSQPVSDVLIVGEDTVEIYPQWMAFDITSVTTP
jgi:hypothetical protein